MSLEQGPERRTRLSTIVLLSDRVIRVADNSDIGLPPSRPRSEIIRVAAGLLLAEATEPVERVLALIGVHWRRERSDPLDAEHQSMMLEAIELSHGDRTLETWVRSVVAGQLVNTQRPDQARRLLEPVADGADGSPVGSLGPWGPAARLWPESFDVAAAAVTVDFFFWNVLNKARRYSGDVEGWADSLQRLVDVSRRAHHRPTLYPMALRAIGARERAFGRQSDMTPWEELDRDAFLVRSSYLYELAENAAARADYDTSIACHRERIDLQLSRRHPELVGAGPVALTEAFAPLSQPLRRMENPIANSAHDIASHFQLSGRAMTDDDDLAETRQWIDLALAVWHDWGTNGARAVRVRSGGLLLDRGEGDADVVEDMLEVALNAPRPGLRSAALLRLATRSTVRLDDILAAADAMLAEDWDTRDRSRLLTARAWLTRPGTELERPSSIEDAEQALALIPERPVGASPQIAWTGWTIAMAGRESGDAELERRGLVEAVLAVGRLLLNATTLPRRLLVARTWHEVIAEALEFARRTDDTDLADLTGEIVRRDGVAALLAQMGSDPLAPTEIAETAADAASAGQADGDTIGAADPGGGSEPEDDTPRFRSAVTAYALERDAEAYARAEELLGPLGRLADPRTLYGTRAADLLVGTSNSYLLQLLPSTVPMVAEDGPPRLHRRLTWVDADGSHDLVDAVPLPAGILDEPDPGDLLAWSDPEALFPGPLVEALGRASREHPIRLLIVPTGLYHLQFDGLAIGPDDHLLDRSLTSIHTSLTAAQHELSAEPSRVQPGSVAVLDVDGLPATAAERAALERWFPDVIDQLDPLSQQGDRPSLLALGVHGDDDADGWGQVKRLPGGRRLTAAEALGYRYPELCVLASCHSRVRVAGGLDHAGFPTAMFARGARTIIGSIGLLPDEETSEILAAFYERLHEVGDPVAAMRDARLTWMDADPDRRDAHESWARIVVYGGAHHSTGRPA